MAYSVEWTGRAAAWPGTWEESINLSSQRQAPRSLSDVIRDHVSNNQFGLASRVAMGPYLLWKVAEQRKKKPGIIQY